MAKYQVMSWHGIPTQVKVSDHSGTIINRQLPPFFAQEVDRVAMSEGLIDSDEYLEGWQWSDAVEYAGTAEDSVDAIVDLVAEEWRRAKP